MQKNETELLILHHSQKLAQNVLRLKLKTIKLLEENIGKKFLDSGHSNNLRDMTPKAQAMAAKINKWNFIKLKSFRTSLAVQW